VSAPATSASASPAAPATPSEQEQAQTLLDRTAQTEQLAHQQAVFQAAGIADMARKAYDENRKEEALRLFTQAATLDPNNAVAVEGRDQVAEELGRATPSSASTLSKHERDILAEKGAITYRFNSAIDDARTATGADDFVKAQTSIDAARVARNSDPGIFTTPEIQNFDSTISSTQVALDAEKESKNRRDANAQAVEADQAQQAANAERLAERDRTVAALIKTAREDVDAGKYEEALGVIDQILVLDPKNDYAVGVRQLVEDKAILQQQRGYREDFNREFEKQLNSAEEMKIPYSDILRYPTNWPDITEARAEEVKSEQGVSRTDAAVQASLDKHLPEVRFDAVGFTDVVDFLRDITGANIFVNWRALEQAGIDKNAPVTARLRDVKFSKALDIILEEVGGGTVKIGYTVDEGVITISTSDDLAKNVVTRVYDVRDLIISVPDFTNAPDFNLSSSSNTQAQQFGAGGAASGAPSNSGSLFGGGGGGGNDNSQQGGTRADLVAQVIKLITDTVATDSWRENGGSVGSIKELSGQLIVTQTPENQSALQALLDQLREYRAIQITIETRFLTVQRNFLENIGLDFNFAFNLNNPNHWSPITVSNNTSSFTANPSSAAPGSLGGAAQGLNVAATFLDDFQVSFLLQATQAEQNNTILTAPRVTLFNGQRGYVVVANEQAYVSNLTPIVANGAVSFQPTIGYANSGIVLDVTGTVSADRKYVTMTLRPTLNDLQALVPFTFQGAASIPSSAGGGLGTIVTGIGAATIEEPVIQTTQVRTTVSVPDGGTLLLGGQTIAGEIEREAGVPILSKIPFLKRLFTNRSTAKDEQILLILVKPTILIEREIENKAFPLLSTKVAG
jgi:general secretion pathway protein D